MKIEMVRIIVLVCKVLIMFIVFRLDILDYLIGSFEEDIVKLFQLIDLEFDEDYDFCVVC